MILNRRISGAVTDMTEGNAGELILCFSLPLIFGNLFQQLYAIVDAVVVGRYVGVDALASVGCISWVCWMINAFLRDCANTFSISASVRVGNHNEKGFRMIVANAVLICVFLGTLVTALLLGGIPIILRLLNVQPNVVHMTRQYLTVFILAIPAGLVYSVATGLLRAYGNSGITFLSMTISTVVNIVLDLVFVLGFGWGVLGAAAATWIAQVVAMVIALRAVVREPAFHISREDLHLDKDLFGELLKLWLPMLFNSLIISVGGLFVESRTNRIGSSFTAGITACMKVFSVMEAIIMAIQTGVSVYVGQNLGAGRFARIRTGLVKIVKLGFAVTAVMILFVFAVQHRILPLFLSAEDPASYERAYWVANADTYIILLSMLLMTPMYLHRVTIQTMGFPVYAALAGMMQLVMRVLTIQFGPAVFGEYAYFVHDGLAWLVSLPVVAIPCYRYLGKRIAEEKIAEDKKMVFTDRQEKL